MFWNLVFFNEKVVSNERGRPSFQILYLRIRYYFPNNVFFVTGNRIFSSNLGSLHFWTLKHFAAMDTCQTISLVRRHCNSMLQACFIVRQNFKKKSSVTPGVLRIYQKQFFKRIPLYVSKFLNF